MDDLKETMETVIKLSNDRLNVLEQALPLAEHFYETHAELTAWLDDIEREVMNQLNPGMRPDQIAKQQEINRSLIQSVQDHKPVLDRLNKTGGALLRLIIEDDAYRIQVKVDRLFDLRQISLSRFNKFYQLEILEQKRENLTYYNKKQ